jgi:hypothetical protein
MLLQKDAVQELPYELYKCHAAMSHGSMNCARLMWFALGATGQSSMMSPQHDTREHHYNFVCRAELIEALVGHVTWSSSDIRVCHSVKSLARRIVSQMPRIVAL